MSPRFMLVFILTCTALTSGFSADKAQAQDFVWAPGFPAGSTIPLLDAPDQHGQTQTLATLAGANGLVLFFNRSFDWCPWCKGQLKDLISMQSGFTQRGYGIATITYDPVATLMEVAEDLDISFALLHDEAVTHVNAYGILNTDNAPDSFAYGVPQPGILIISPQGIILAKFAEQNYRERPDLSWVLEQLDAL